MITGFDHYTVRTADLQASWRFYEQVLGLRVETRPGVSMPAAIVSLDGLQLVHLFQASAEQEEIFARHALGANPDVPGWRTGRLQHVGFWARDVEGMRARLEARGIPFRERQGGEKHQFVVYDPDQVEIEI